MGEHGGGVRWYSPDPRCIIDLNEFHASRRLMRTFRNAEFECRVNTAWDEVLQCCADREDVWITPQIISAYTELHHIGNAHSVEAYKHGQLAGGLYGVAIGGAFMGESMFHRVTDASKVSLVFLVERLRQRGFTLLDCQFITEHLRSLGAKLIAREEYLQRLASALSLNCSFN